VKVEGTVLVLVLYAFITKPLGDGDGADAGVVVDEYDEDDTAVCLGLKASAVGSIEDAFTVPDDACLGLRPIAIGLAQEPVLPPVVVVLELLSLDCVSAVGGKSPYSEFIVYDNI
jgi:hypothetical protein